MGIDAEKVIDAGLEAVKGYVDRGVAEVVRRLEKIEGGGAGAISQGVEARVGAKGMLAPATRAEVCAVADALRDVQRRLKELEARPSLKYVGTWEAERQYNEGEFVTFDGSLWHCRGLTRSKPGSTDKWQLAVKRGQDGKR